MCPAHQVVLSQLMYKNSLVLNKHTYCQLQDPSKYTLKQLMEMPWGSSICVRYFILITIEHLVTPAEPSSQTKL